MNEREIARAIAALETQRATLGDAPVETLIAIARQRLEALDPARTIPQRKQITVLFADLSRFIALAERMDVEAVGETLNSLWARLDRAITAHGGTIDKHIGDGVMALFGAPIAREDDPQRAIQAALAIQQEVSQLRLEMLCPAHGLDPDTLAYLHPLAVRIGIHTGPVLLDRIGTTAEYTAVGDTVNLASRLQEMAPKGGILISQETYRHVRNIVDARALGPVYVRGRRERVQPYVVRGSRPPDAHACGLRREGHETPMIGREAELERLQQRLHQVMSASEARIVTIAGEAGIGKSRLLYEFQEQIVQFLDNVVYFYGQASRQTGDLTTSVLYPYRVSSTRGPQNDPPIIALQELEQEIALLMDNARAIVLFWEDAHRAGDRSLNLLKRLARVYRRSPLLIVASARPQLFEGHPTWAQEDKTEICLELGPLSKPESRRLARETLRPIRGCPRQAIDWIVERAEGNPLFIRELVYALTEDKATLQGADRWQARLERSPHLRAPSTVIGLLQACLDELPALERETLQRAAVVGRVFWDGALEHLNRNQGRNEAQTARALAALQRKGLIRRRASSTLPGQEEYAFGHGFLHEVTYESVLKEQRQADREHVTAWLLARGLEQAAAGERAGAPQERSDHIRPDPRVLERTALPDPSREKWRRRPLQIGNRRGLTPAHALGAG